MFYMHRITNKDLESLKQAKSLLESDSIAIKLTNLIGSPIEKGINQLPINWQNAIASSTHISLNKALDIALYTMDDKHSKSSNFAHKLSVGFTGALGGAGGITTLPIELPISTTLILRSIMDIARSEGANIKRVETKLSCLEVFSLGGPSSNDNAMNSSYFASRVILAEQVSEAMSHMAIKTISKESPILIKFITCIAERFGVQVSQKVMAQAVPIVGAISGALINTIFINHFQNMAKGHFVIKRLEANYGKDTIKGIYLSEI
jgi:hypothetical protein